MKPVVCDRPGPPDLLRLEEVAKPIVPDDGVLVRVRACSVNPAENSPLVEGPEGPLRPCDHGSKLER
jgi:NADPH:quinone reductase-like Zn-dependent oxidoreductase